MTLFFLEWLEIFLYRKKPAQLAQEKPSWKKGLLHLALATFLVGIVSSAFSYLDAQAGGMADVPLSFLPLDPLPLSFLSLFLQVFSNLFFVLAFWGLFFLFGKAFFSFQGTFRDMLGLLGMIFASIEGTAGLGLELVFGTAFYFVQDPESLAALVLLGMSAFLGLALFLWSLFLAKKAFSASFQMPFPKFALSYLMAAGVLVFFLVVLGILFFLVGLTALPADDLGALDALGP